MKWIVIGALTAAAAWAQGNVFYFAGKQAEFEGKVVTGAPYSAQATTETTQVLADGTRISRKTSSSVTRDSQGRTRREQSLELAGPWPSGDAPQLVFINDPVTGVRYTVDASSRSVTKSSSSSPIVSVRQKLDLAKLKDEGRGEQDQVVITSDSLGTQPTVQMRQNAHEVKLQAEMKAAGRRETGPATTTKTESLGTQTIEGVQAEGKRITETIPAGKIGNDRPIEIVNETWYSPDLQTVVMSKHSDPRTGDVIYSMTNIIRAEPDPSLFSPPADYKVREESKWFEIKE